MGVIPIIVESRRHQQFRKHFLLDMSSRIEGEGREGRKERKEGKKGKEGKTGRKGRKDRKKRKKHVILEMEGLYPPEIKVGEVPMVESVLIQFDEDQTDESGQALNSSDVVQTAE